MSDLFGNADATTPTFMGERFDAMCRKAGGWPDDAIGYAFEVIGSGPDPMVMITGGVPSGLKKNGDPKFDRKHIKHKCGVRLSEYRAAFPATPTDTIRGEGQ